MENRGIDHLKVVEQQNAVIRIQSRIIDELFILLMQHISAKEAGNLPCIDKINEVAQIRTGINLD